MHKSNFLLRLTALIAASSLWSCSQLPGETAADLVLKNGNIYTVNDARSWAQAVAITKGRFSYVGTEADLESFIGPNTQVVDLRGRMVLPGMFDAHIHAHGGGIEKLNCDLSAESIFEEHGGFPDDLLDEYLTRIERCALEHADAEWVVGSGWLMDAFGPGGRASRELLDEIIPNRAVYMESSDGHSAWVNSRALEIAGVTAATPDPPNGLIDREPGSTEPLVRAVPSARKARLTRVNEFPVAVRLKMFELTSAAPSPATSPRPTLSPGAASATGEAQSSNIAHAEASALLPFETDISRSPF